MAFKGLRLGIKTERKKSFAHSTVIMFGYTLAFFALLCTAAYADDAEGAMMAKCAEENDMSDDDVKGLMKKRDIEGTKDACFVGCLLFNYNIIEEAGAWIPPGADAFAKKKNIPFFVKTPVLKCAYKSQPQSQCEAGSKAFSCCRNYF